MTKFFDVTIPLARNNPDGSRDTHDVAMRIPATSQVAANRVAHDFAWELLHSLPDVGDNNCHGWKLTEIVVGQVR